LIDVSSQELEAVGQSARPQRRVSRPKAVLAVAVLGCFMAFVDATIVNIAVPNIAKEFPARACQVSLGPECLQHRVCRLSGRRRPVGRPPRPPAVFSLALLLFTLASALCAVAPSLNALIAARLIQAAGAAALVPSSLAIVLEAHDARERMHAVALWSAVADWRRHRPAPRGLLITASSWRLVFLVNIPWVWSRSSRWRVLVESRAPGRRYMPDVLGGVVFALAIASLVLAVVKGQEWGGLGARGGGVPCGASLGFTSWCARAESARP